MRPRDTIRTLTLILVPCLLLPALRSAALAEDCRHCPKTEFYRPKPPCIKFNWVCPMPMGCGTLEHFGYYPTCWNAWPFPPDCSHCPARPVMTAVPSAALRGSAPGEQLHPPQKMSKPAQSTSP